MTQENIVLDRKESLTQENIAAILQSQREYFNSGATLPLDFRLHQLQKLKNITIQHSSEIISALKADLSKPKAEAITNETLLITEEIDFIKKYLAQWMKPKKVKTPFPSLWPGQSKVYYQPYGSALIIGPWNYPFLLVFSPLIGAISAGNCAIVKPSEVAPNTQNLIVRLINEHFPREFLYAVKADVDETTALLKHRFDYIFFTGGTAVGKIIMAAAAQHLTPLTLELGGKSPCIVDDSINLDYVARRLAWGKTLNAGQVCLAPDYLYVSEQSKAALIEKLKFYFNKFFENNPAASKDFGRIVNAKHFARLKNIMQSHGKIIYGGDMNEKDLYIAPTMISDITFDSPIMREEIFGPLLPILSFKTFEEVIPNIQSLPKPLALYLFSKDKKTQQRVINSIAYGGGCINDCVLHLINHHLPFGGVGDSGLGQYHGEYSFQTFSHRKGIYQKNILFDIAVQYPPFTEQKLKWYQRLLRL